MDFNYKCMEFVAESLQVDWQFDKTEEFIKLPEEKKDLRYLVDAKSNHGFENTRYNQVFEEKTGFLSNLCILDLLFNEGNASLSYLQEQKL
jgi:hypothetical protein